MPESDDVVQRARQALDGITPGPWKIDDYDESALDSIVSVADDRLGGWVEVARSTGDDARFIAAAPDLVRKLAAEVEKLRAQPVELSAQLLADAAGWEAVAEEHADTIGKVDAEVEKLCATVDRVRKLAERWEADPCVCGYRIPDGNDTDSQCLHCGATSLLHALDGGGDRG